MVRWGNKRANEYWEATVPEDYYIPDENDSVAAVERWIRDKYERGKFKAKSTPKWAEEDIDLNQPMSVLVSGGGADKGKEKKEKKEKDSSKVSIKVNAVTGSSSTTSSTPNPSSSSTTTIKSSTATPVVAATFDSFDLLGFDAFPTTPSVPTPAPQATTHNNNVADLASAFGNIGINPSAASTSATASFDPFGSSSSSSSSSAATTVNPAANILNLYATNPVVPTQPNMMMNNPFGNNQPNMMMGGNMMMPGQGMPNMMMPGQGMPNMMMPGQGMPNMMMPGQGMPNMMMPQQQPHQQSSFVPTPAVITTPAPTNSISNIDPFASF
jgi:hypothetical protein